MRLFSLLPLRIHHFNSHILSYLIRNVFKYRTSVVMDNLTKSFPEKSEAEIKHILKQFYDHFANIIVEAVWFGGCKNPDRLKKARIMQVKNPEELRRLYDISPSVMVMCSHCGNWELYGGIQYYCDEDCYPSRSDNTCRAYLKLNSRVWDEVIRDNRLTPIQDKEHFTGYVESKQIVRYVYKHRGEKIFYSFTTDQRPYAGSSDNVEVNFMNRKCHTMKAAASLARKFGMSVTFLRIDVLDKGHYILDYRTICDNASTMSVEEIMTKYYELLEEEIREQPWNYLWTHNRWKHHYD